MAYNYLVMLYRTIYYLMPAWTDKDIDDFPQGVSPADRHHFPSRHSFGFQYKDTFTRCALLPVPSRSALGDSTVVNAELGQMS